MIKNHNVIRTVGFVIRYTTTNNYYKKRYTNKLELKCTQSFPTASLDFLDAHTFIYLRLCIFIYCWIKMLYAKHFYAHFLNSGASWYFHQAIFFLCDIPK